MSAFSWAAISSIVANELVSRQRERRCAKAFPLGDGAGVRRGARATESDRQAAPSVDDKTCV